MIVAGLVTLLLGVWAKFDEGCQDLVEGCADTSNVEFDPEVEPVVENEGAFSFILYGGITMSIGLIWALINGAGDARMSTRPTIPQGPTDMQLRAMVIESQRARQAQANPPVRPPQDGPPRWG